MEQAIRAKQPDVSADLRLPSLTGLRFLAAFFVFCMHVCISGLFRQSTALHVLTRFFGNGSAWVSFFFVLSGFVMTWSARPGDTAPAFWRRRWARIYPNHVVTWVAAIIGIAAMSQTVAVSVWLPNLLLVQSWFPDAGIYGGVNVVSWSLSCEAFFYLMFPWLLRLLSRLPEARLRVATVVTAALAIAAPWATLPLHENLRVWLLYFFPPVRMLEFVLGILVALTFRAGRWPRVPLWAAGVLVAVAYLLIRYAPYETRFATVTLIPFALLIPAAAASDLAGRPTVWRSRWMIWLGETSFAFYLVHRLILMDLIHALHAQGASTITACAVTVASLGLSLVMAAALRRYVEVPLARRLGPPRRRPSPVTVRETTMT